MAIYNNRSKRGVPLTRQRRKVGLQARRTLNRASVVRQRRSTNKRASAVTAKKRRWVGKAVGSANAVRKKGNTRTAQRRKSLDRVNTGVAYALKIKPGKYVTTQSTSDPRWPEYKLTPAAVPVRSGKDEALDCLFAEYQDLKQRYPEWAKNLKLDFNTMSATEKARLADDVEAVARTLHKQNPALKGVALDKNAPLYRYAADAVLGSKAAGLPLDTVTGIICKESSGWCNAVSRVGCLGLMQVYHNYHRNTFCKGLSPQETMNPLTNVFLGCQILKAGFSGKSTDHCDTARMRRHLLSYVGANMTPAVRSRISRCATAKQLLDYVNGLPTLDQKAKNAIRKCSSIEQICKIADDVKRYPGIDAATRSRLKTFTSVQEAVSFAENGLSPDAKDYISDRTGVPKFAHRFMREKAAVAAERKRGTRPVEWTPVVSQFSLNDLKEKTLSLAGNGVQKLSQTMEQTAKVRGNIANAARRTVQVASPAAKSLQQFTEMMQTSRNAAASKTQGQAAVQSQDKAAETTLMQKAANVLADVTKIALGKQTGINKDVAATAPNMMRAAFMVGSIYALAKMHRPEGALGLFAAGTPAAATAKELTEPLPNNSNPAADKAQQKVLAQYDQKTQAAGQIIVNGLKEGKSQGEISAAVEPTISSALENLARAIKTYKMYHDQRNAEQAQDQDQGNAHEPQAVQRRVQQQTGNRGMER